MINVNGPSILMGKYALYWPRPGRNVSPAKRRMGTDAGEETTTMKEHQPVNEDDAGATCHTGSELSYIYENTHKAMTYAFP